MQTQQIASGNRLKRLAHSFSFAFYAAEARNSGLIRRHRLRSDPSKLVPETRARLK